MGRAHLKDTSEGSGPYGGAYSRCFGISIQRESENRMRKHQIGRTRELEYASKGNVCDRTLGRSHFQNKQRNNDRIQMRDRYWAGKGGETFLIKVLLFFLFRKKA